MVSVLKSRLPLMLSAAGISRADTPRGWVVNALRAVNFVLVTFAFSVLIYATFFLFVFLPVLLIPLHGSQSSLIAFLGTIAITASIGTLSAIFLIPRLLTSIENGTRYSDYAFFTELKGYVLALATSSAIVLIYWLGPYTYQSEVSVDIAVLSWPVVILVNGLLLVSNGVTSWKIRRGCISIIRVILWTLNMAAFAVMLFIGMFWWFFLLLGHGVY